jgi:hypothetical protein
MRATSNMQELDRTLRAEIVGFEKVMDALQNEISALEPKDHPKKDESNAP